MHMIKSKGFSIVELMIALTIGLLLLTLVMGTFTSNMANGQVDMDRTRLNTMIFDALNQMGSEIARAGSWSATTVHSWGKGTLTITQSNNTLTPENPGSFPIISPPAIGPIVIPLASAGYTSGAAQLTNYDGSGAPADGTILEPFVKEPEPPEDMFTLLPNEWVWVSPFAYDNDTSHNLQIVDDSCILFTYDKQNNGIIDTAEDNNDRFGYRLIDESGVGVIQKRIGGATFNCTSTTDNEWRNITDPNEINITQLAFSNVEPALLFTANGKAMQQQVINITISANLIDDSANAQSTKSETVVVRNASVTI